MKTTNDSQDRKQADTYERKMSALYELEHELEDLYDQQVRPTVAFIQMRLEKYKLPQEWVPYFVS